MTILDPSELYLLGCKFDFISITAWFASFEQILCDYPKAGGL